MHLFFVEVYFTYYRINHYKGYKSVEFSVFIMLCNYHFSLTSILVFHPFKKPIPLSNQCPLSFSFSSVTQSCPTLCDPMNPSMPGLPVHHQLPEFTQTHVHRVSEAIQHLILCCPLLLLPPIRPIRVFSNESALHMSGQSIGVSASVSVLPVNTQD